MTFGAKNGSKCCVICTLGHGGVTGRNSLPGAKTGCNVSRACLRGGQFSCGRRSPRFDSNIDVDAIGHGVKIELPNLFDNRSARDGLALMEDAPLSATICTETCSCCNRWWRNSASGASYSATRMRIGTHQTVNLKGGETIVRVTERWVNEVSRPDSAKGIH
jgi:hypothetical protein